MSRAQMVRDTSCIFPSGKSCCNRRGWGKNAAFRVCFENLVNLSAVDPAPSYGQVTFIEKSCRTASPLNLAYRTRK